MPNYWLPTVNQKWDYDYYPRVVALGKDTEITIRPTGCKTVFSKGNNYLVEICATECGSKKDFPKQSSFVVKSAIPQEDGSLCFSYAFECEMEYFARVYREEVKIENFIDCFPVYCVGGDLVGRYPFQGDTHMHTYYSDGKQSPEVVCSNYRKFGYDFIAITDHRRYYPSLKAVSFGQEVPTEMCICPGEEVQLTDADGQHNDVHIINFGGDYSVNAMIEGVQTQEVGTDPKTRSSVGECPKTMTREEFAELMRDLCSKADYPEWMDIYPAVNCKWIFDQIRNADGLSIFAHPNWINNVYHVPERFVDYMVENKWFDAFEVLGGETYFEQNGFQTLRYYNDWARGYRYPIVGATDSHSSYETNKSGFVANTIVFSPRNETKALIKSIKEFYSVAVDTISKEYRIVGDPRLGRYASFLLRHYFPLHNELCREEGMQMKIYATGTEEEKAEALKVLKTIYGRVDRQRRKYFGF